MENLKTEEFTRVRVGIGQPTYKEDIINYVLGAIPKKEVQLLDESCENAANSVIEIIENGIDSAMNVYN